MNTIVEKIDINQINKESIDARKKPEIYYIYEVDLDLLNEELILRKNKSNDILKIDEKEYDEEILEQACVYSDIAKQPNRKKCALLAWWGIEKVLKEN